MRPTRFLALTAIALLVGCGGGGSDAADRDSPSPDRPDLADASRTCEAFDLDDANALVTNSDTGQRKIDGDITAAITVDSDTTVGAGTPVEEGTPIQIVALNVGGTIVTLMRAADSSFYAALDDVSADATSFPRNADRFGITADDDAISAAQSCARSGQQPTTTAPVSGFDVEAWRAEAIRRFGPEETHPDGSKDDYVQLAESLCEQSDSDRATMRSNLGSDYEGSVQQFIIEEFCPNA